MRNRFGGVLADPPMVGNRRGGESLLAPHRVPGRIRNRHIQQALNVMQRVIKSGSWRDSYNPLRGLTIARAVTLLEEGERGALAELQWTYRHIEMQDATLGALIERRTSAIQRLGWDVKIPDELTGPDLALAEKQAAHLREVYERIDNLREAFEFLAMASFRGYSHLEKITDAEGRLTSLSPVEQWWWVREGLWGRWTYNPEARFGVILGQEVPLESFVIRECARPINRVALIAGIRKGMSQKDWDGFVEVYGIPPVFLIMPEGLTPEERDAYQEVGESIISDSRGTLPAGSDVKTLNNGERGQNPFMEHINYQDAQLVLRGTGGKLTMLAESGSGTLAGSAHADTFDAIAQAEAEEISEILQRHIDRAELDAAFPGQKHLAYFEIASADTGDAGDFFESLRKLSLSGYKVGEDLIEERTGIAVEFIGMPGLDSEQVQTARVVKKAEDGKPIPAAPDPKAAPEDIPDKEEERGKVLNRESLNADGQLTEALIRAGVEGAAGVLPDLFAPLAEALQRLIQQAEGDIPDDRALVAEARRLIANFPEYLDGIQAGPLAEVLAHTLGTATVAGTAEALHES